MIKIILILLLLTIVTIAFRPISLSSSSSISISSSLSLKCVEEKISSSNDEKYQLFAGNLPFSLTNDELKQIVADRIGSRYY